MAWCKKSGRQQSAKTPPNPPAAARHGKGQPSGADARRQVSVGECKDLVPGENARPSVEVVKDSTQEDTERMIRFLKERGVPVTATDPRTNPTTPGRATPTGETNPNTPFGNTPFGNTPFGNTPTGKDDNEFCETCKAEKGTGWEVRRILSGEGGERTKWRPGQSSDRDECEKLAKQYFSAEDGTQHLVSGYVQEPKIETRACSKCRSYTMGQAVALTGVISSVVLTGAFSGYAVGEWTRGQDVEGMTIVFLSIAMLALVIFACYFIGKSQRSLSGMAAGFCVLASTVTGLIGIGYVTGLPLITSYSDDVEGAADKTEAIMTINFIFGAALLLLVVGMGFLAYYLRDNYRHDWGYSRGIALASGVVTLTIGSYGSMTVLQTGLENPEPAIGAAAGMGVLITIGLLCIWYVIMYSEHMLGKWVDNRRASHFWTSIVGAVFLLGAGICIGVGLGQVKKSTTDAADGTLTAEEIAAADKFAQAHEELSAAAETDPELEVAWHEAQEKLSSLNETNEAEDDMTKFFTDFAGDASDTAAICLWVGIALLFVGLLLTFVAKRCLKRE